MMNEGAFKNILGPILILTHLLLIILSIILWFLDGFTAYEFIIIIGITVPMFSGYATSVVLFSIKTKYKTNSGKQLSFLFKFATLTYITVYFVSVFTVIILQAFSLAFSNFSEFIVFLISLESLFAIYTTRLIGICFVKS